MRYDDLIDLLKLFAKALLAPMSIYNSPKKNATLKYPRHPQSNNSINYTMNNNIYAESEVSNIKYNANDSIKDNPSEYSKSYSDNKNNNYYNEQKDTSSNPQGVIDSIAQELTYARLQQAIILSEIVGKPRSKTRKKRRF